MKECHRKQKHYEERREEYSSSLEAVERDLEHKRRMNQDVLHKASAGGTEERPEGDLPPARDIRREIIRLQEINKMQKNIQEEVRGQRA